MDVLQLLDLFIQWDWSTYLADYGQPNCKYLRVNPVTALTLLEKWVPSPVVCVGGWEDGDGGRIEGDFLIANTWKDIVALEVAIGTIGGLRLTWQASLPLLAS